MNSTENIHIITWCENITVTEVFIPVDVKEIIMCQDHMAVDIAKWW